MLLSERKLVHLSQSASQKGTPVSCHLYATSTSNWSQRWKQHDTAWQNFFNYSPSLALGPRLFNSFTVALSIPHHLLYSWIKNMEKVSMWSSYIVIRIYFRNSKTSQVPLSQTASGATYNAWCREHLKTSRLESKEKVRRHYYIK